MSADALYWVETFRLDGDRLKADRKVQASSEAEAAVALANCVVPTVAGAYPYVMTFSAD